MCIISTNLTNIGHVINVQGDIGQNNSMITYANIVMQKLTYSKCNIHIQFGIEVLNTSSPNGNAFNLGYLKNLLNINTLSFDQDNTRISLINENFSKSTNGVRAGYNILNDGSIGRFYKYGEETGFAIIPVKTLCDSNFLKTSGLYEIDIFGATYS